jgi:hypothetical protein
MGLKGFSVALITLSCLLAIGCGGDVPVVWLEILEDATNPCLGASHMKVKVNVNQKEIKYDQFGLFFKTDGQFGCNINQFTFTGLPLGKGVNVELLLYDSSTDTNSGLLSEGRSIDFDVSASSLPKSIRINLTRKPAIQRGTLVVQAPGNWTDVLKQMGIVVLQFRVLLADDQSFVRSGYIASFDATREDRKNPFPIVISNLPTPPVITEFYIQLDGMKRDVEGNLIAVATWGGSAWLSTGSATIAYTTLD